MSQHEQLSADRYQRGGMRALRRSYSLPCLTAPLLLSALLNGSGLSPPANNSSVLRHRLTVLAEMATKRRKSKEVVSGWGWRGAGRGEGNGGNPVGAEEGGWGVEGGGCLG